MERLYIIGFTILAAFGLMYGLASLAITGQVVKEVNEKVVIYFPNSADFPNPEEGTVVFNFGFPATEFKVGNKSADSIVFMNSGVIPGLKIGYDLKERKLYSGLPLMVSEEIKVIDGKNHKLAYTFNRKQKMQALYLDDQKVLEGEFTGEQGTGAIGYAVYDNVMMVESKLPLDMRFE